MSEQFIKLHTWMATDLHLTGNELIVFAVIHSYTTYQGGYAGGMEPLMELTGLTKCNVYGLIRKLKDKGCIGLANASKGRVHSTYVSLVNRIATDTVNKKPTVSETVSPPIHNRIATDTLLDNRYIDTPYSPPTRGTAHADAKPERKRRSSGKRRRAVDIISSGSDYSSEGLKRIGISQGEEFYDSLDELRIE